MCMCPPPYLPLSSQRNMCPCVPSPSPSPQCLEERGLVVKTAIMARAENSSVAGNMHLSNLVHLKRYAPRVKLLPNQYFKVWG